MKPTQKTPTPTRRQSPDASLLFSDEELLQAAESAFGRRPDRIVDRSGANVKFAWRPGLALDPLNFSDWYHYSDLSLYKSLPRHERQE